MIYFARFFLIYLIIICTTIAQVSSPEKEINNCINFILSQIKLLNIFKLVNWLVTSLILVFITILYTKLSFN